MNGAIPALLAETPYQSYVYGYPHKTAYRQLETPISIHDAWKNENLSGVILYVHIPFCSMRCGFCNLFTQAKPGGELVSMYLDALTLQTKQLRESLGEIRPARVAIGGGTPTFLDESQLARVFDLLPGSNRNVPTAIEVSPETLTSIKVDLLKHSGVSRVSMGIQSFIESETSQCGRPQKRGEVDTSLQLLRDANFPALNLDLIYGLPGQTLQSWEYSLRTAIQWRPEEMYLYPLYVRPLTGLGRSNKEWDDIRLQCYRRGREMLLESGYEQVSMRFFRKPDPNGSVGPIYCCQSDGMIGLGCGARSYTQALHYSSEYAVGAKGIREILRGYVTREDFTYLDYGISLNREEQQRRFLLQSLLHFEGLSQGDYLARFGAAVESDFPELFALQELGLIDAIDDRFCLTERGYELSDAIGPMFFSESVRELMQEYALR